jgi:hypothetical protein
MAEDGRDMPGDDLFDRLYNALSEGGSDAATLRTSLERDGVNVDRVLRQGLELFSTFVGQQQLARAREQLDQVRSLLTRIKHAPLPSVGALRDDFARALAGADTGDAYFAYYRKLESIDPDDLASLPDDAAVLDFISRLAEQDPAP